MLEPKDSFKYLPLVYDEAGLSTYADRQTPELIEFLWKNDWIGRNVLEVGCGTGASLDHFADQKMTVDAVDVSADMLKKAHHKMSEFTGDTTINFIHADIRSYKPRPAIYDLVFCLDTLNHITSPRELENIMRRANYALAMGKAFLFDLHTIGGLVAEVSKHPTHILHTSFTDFVVTNSAFDFDTSSLVIDYHIFVTHQGGALERFEERHVLRGYPFKAVEAMLGRAGFAVKTVVGTDLTPFDEVKSRERIMFLAEKVREFND